MTKSIDHLYTVMSIGNSLLNYSPVTDSLTKKPLQVLLELIRLHASRREEYTTLLDEATGKQQSELLKKTVDQSERFARELLNEWSLTGEEALPEAGFELYWPVDSGDNPAEMLSSIEDAFTTNYQAAVEAGNVPSVLMRLMTKQMVEMSYDH